MIFMLASGRLADKGSAFHIAQHGPSTLKKASEKEIPDRSNFSYFWPYYFLPATWVTFLNWKTEQQKTNWVQYGLN